MGLEGVRARGSVEVVVSRARAKPVRLVVVHPRPGRESLRRGVPAEHGDVAAAEAHELRDARVVVPARAHAHQVETRGDHLHTLELLPAREGDAVDAEA